MSKIQSLGDDLALVLGAKSIRILAPIPGKTTVGIEVPNDAAGMLQFSALVPEMLKQKEQCLPVVLGMDVYNKTQMPILRKCPISWFLELQVLVKVYYEQLDFRFDHAQVTQKFTILNDRS